MNSNSIVIMKSKNILASMREKPFGFVCSGIGLLLLSVCVLTITGCGNSGGGEIEAPIPASQPTTATVRIFTQGTLIGTKIYGVDIYTSLPAGVTIKATADTVNSSVFMVNQGLVAASGVGVGTQVQVLATYTAASSSSAGKVHIRIMNPDGFGTGEFATAVCDIAAGYTPKEADFSQAGFIAYDVNGAPISGLNAAITVEIK